MECKIYTGLGGGFGGASYEKTDKYPSKEAAEHEARELSIEQFESYDGMHGLRNYQDCLEEAESELNEDDFADFDEYTQALEAWANDVYEEELESWIDYYVEEVE